MCDTCDNKGGIVVNHGWFAEFKPCPDRNCDFDAEAELNRKIAVLKEKIKLSERAG
ncbi:hypothetical protein [Lentibacillus cibarius]|uniref:hypothetical protein n=1 Tax=Lentibacillus cibarius TaxID=2583219 RepID=UPI00163DE5E2|nr:hypothetical protein [Lentibacillus cibarius]